MAVNTFSIGILMAYFIIAYFIIFICVFVANLLFSWKHRWRSQHGFACTHSNAYIWNSSIECMMLGSIWPYCLLDFISNKWLGNYIKSIVQFVKHKGRAIVQKVTQPVLLRLFLSKKECSLFHEQQVQKALGTIDTMYTNKRSNRGQ